MPDGLASPCRCCQRERQKCTKRRRCLSLACFRQELDSTEIIISSTCCTGEDYEVNMNRKEGFEA